MQKNLPALRSKEIDLVGARAPSGSITVQTERQTHLKYAKFCKGQIELFEPDKHGLYILQVRLVERM